MVDPNSWIVYETEDENSSGFYKFVPYRKGQLARGGRLYMLKVVDQWQANLGGAFELGTTWKVEWVRIEDPSGSSGKTPFQQGRDKGGAEFRRLEGCWWEGRVGYFLSTDGGQVGEGQVFEYDPRRERIKLIYDSPSQAESENPDNIVVTPRGGLLMCEDNSGATTNDAERLIGLTLKGKAFTFAKNNVNLAVLGVPSGKTVPPNDSRQSEWAGACYSPDGRWLFVNIQTPGITFAITGPWHRGPL
jgi:secreted PhoX family phosphatase